MTSISGTGVFGIDLGTTNSVIAHLRDGTPQAIAIDGDPVVPSVVLYADDGQVVVGREARNLALMHPDRVVRSIKRRMGQPEPVEIAGRSLTPVEISAEILRWLCRGAEAQLGDPVREAVITVPAYFNDAQRRATLAAGERAGLRVSRLLNEPTSASLVYDRVDSSAGGSAGGAEPELVLVYDLGGGTFDVSVLEVFGDIREVRATTGNTRLGGDDFDEVLVRMFVDELDAGGLALDAGGWARLRRAAEDAKIALSRELEVEVREEFIASARGKPVHLERGVTRREFEDAIAQMLRSTVELAQRAVDEAMLGPDERIARICLVGGSTRIPLVRSLLAEAFDADIHEEIDVDLAVGLGAAIQSGMLSGVSCDRLLVDVSAHTLGLRAIGSQDDPLLQDEPDTFVPVLRRNTVLPAERTQELYTAVSHQEVVHVEVFQGEAARCSENLAVGDFEFELEPAPIHTPIRFRFAYDLDGIVRVTASQPGPAGRPRKDKTVALRLPDASDRAAAPPTASPSGPDDNALLRRARKLLATLHGDAHARLLTLVVAWQESAPARRGVLEDQLLDFFLEQEAEGEP